MEFETNKQDGFVVLKVRGRMDAVTAPEFEAKCGEFIDAGDTAFVVDLSGLEYISSAGLRSILATAKKLKAKDGKLVFANLAGMVQEVFSISGFTAMFKVFDTIDDAVAKG